MNVISNRHLKNPSDDMDTLLRLEPQARTLRNLTRRTACTEYYVGSSFLMFPRSTVREANIKI